jgi:hypothetical protein
MECLCVPYEVGLGPDMELMAHQIGAMLLQMMP